MQILTVDFETYFDNEYNLNKCTTESYIRDPRFAAHGVGLRYDGDLIWVAEPTREGMEEVANWDRTAVLCHHAAFDGLILSHHFGIIPDRWLDTYSMAQYLFGAEQSKSLSALASRFGLAPKTVPYDAIRGRRYGELRGAERRELADGCLHDCELTYTIFQRMMKGDY